MKGLLVSLTGSSSKNAILVFSKTIHWRRKICLTLEYLYMWYTCILRSTLRNMHNQFEACRDFQGQTINTSSLELTWFFYNISLFRHSRIRMVSLCHHKYHIVLNKVNHGTKWQHQRLWNISQLLLLLFDICV